MICYESEKLDCSYEFRDYGATISVQKRNIEFDKILYAPFYPYHHTSDFQGFPVNVAGKIILLSGGAYYKIIDENDTFVRIIIRILKENPSSIFFFTGMGHYPQLLKLIKENSLQDRFILLGWRKDIEQLIERCDIYISTYPYSGGLMSQMAAMKSKPIIALNDGTFLCEKLVCTKQFEVFSCESIDKLCEEASALISNSSLREQKGRRIASLMIGKDEFRSIIIDSLSKKNRSCSCSEIIDYDKISQDYLDRLNKNVAQGSIEWSILKCLVIFPGMFKVLFNLIPNAAVYFFRRIRRRQ